MTNSNLKVGDGMNHNNEMTDLERLRAMQDGQEVMKWHGWGSPIGLALGFGGLMISAGVMFYLLHLANLVG